MAAWVVGAGSILGSSAAAQDYDPDALARQLSNPVASLISIPLQYNLDTGLGPTGNGRRTVLNIQPVIPFSLSEDWNLISRTIVPVVTLDNVVPGQGRTSGIGDTLQSFFLSPAAPTESGLIWGVGAAFLIPTATDDLLGAGQWAAGPTGVALVQTGPTTFGVLANHLWTIGDDNGAPINQTFVQPFFSYRTPDNWTLSLNTETSYDWENDAWSVPINANASRIVRIGALPVSLSAGVRYWAETPRFGPDEWSLRVGATILLPR